MQQLQLDVLRLAGSSNAPLSQTLLANAMLVLLAPLPLEATSQVLMQLLISLCVNWVRLDLLALGLYYLRTCIRGIDVLDAGMAGFTSITA